MNNSYELPDPSLLRSQHRYNLESGIYEETLGHKCVNCGSEDNIVYHHIVPLSQGGTNRLTNIVPVCIRCHKAIHNDKHRKEYDTSWQKGREPKVDRAIREEALWHYVNCEIDKPMLRKILKLSDSDHITDRPFYKAFLKKNHIVKCRNYIAVQEANGHPVRGQLAGYIVYDDGTIKQFYHGHIKQYTREELKL